MVLKLYLLQIHRRICGRETKSWTCTFHYGHNYVLFIDGRTYFVLGYLISPYIVDLPILFLFWIVYICWVKKSVEGESNYEENRDAEVDFHQVGEWWRYTKAKTTWDNFSFLNYLAEKIFKAYEIETFLFWIKL